MPKSRTSRILKVARKMHIYCEGLKTEPNYLRSYIDSLDNPKFKDIICVEKTNKNTPTQLVQEAVAAKNSGQFPDGDVYWVVYDRESSAKYSDHLHDQAFTKALDNGVNIALTSVCFEQWLILHFTDSQAPYSCFNDLIGKSCLKERIRSLTGKNYEKGSRDIFKYVKANIKDARRRAAAINNQALRAAPPGRDKPYLLNPYSDIPKLLDAIDNFNS
ncbi:hypothetical protein PSCICL_40050 [Pseudomonas cichorii]|nr:RloB family protein [Pseudomonas cichorii]GFM73013.1 hypothetical protein PSCICL_40050 [Pseudomonas cichorii]